uniref:Putative secreted protein n=1 Tax=Amblyomma cajennense TaxID=34607 RepID=A0A023FC35_AMBCJ
MASALFWTLILTVTVVKAFPVFQDTLIANYPWFVGYNPAWHNGYYWAWPQWWQANWRVPQAQGIAPRESPANQPPPQAAMTSQVQGGGEKTEVVRSDSGAAQEDEHGFPRYGGSCPLSRYGIQYDKLGRKRPRRARYGGGHEHPSSLDPHDLPPSSIFSDRAREEISRLLAQTA